MATFVPRCQKWTPTGGVVVAAEWRTLETAGKLTAIVVIVLFWLFPLSGGKFPLHISQDGLEAVLPLHLRHVYPQEREEIVWALNLIRKIESIYRCFVRDWDWPIIVCIRLEHQGWIILLIADSGQKNIYISSSGHRNDFYLNIYERFMGKNNCDLPRCKLYAAFHILFASPINLPKSGQELWKNVLLIRINTGGLILSQQHINLSF